MIKIYLIQINDYNVNVNIVEYKYRTFYFKEVVLRMLTFLKAQGTRVVNELGEDIKLIGVGLGNWLLPEGYMWLWGDTQADRPRRIETVIQGLIGKEESTMFWEGFYSNYIVEEDIKRISELGFNSIRLPINYRFIMNEDGTFREERLLVLDKVIKWCGNNNLYVVLDLHGAPGGQTGTNIDDSVNDFPELFTNRRFQEQTIEIWTCLATRYKDNSIVAGYDLLNEPLPDWFREFNDKLVELYHELISEIRKIDNKHIIILEGVVWANDWSIFTDRFGDNIVLQAHKYWNNPDYNSIKNYIEIGETLDYPIWIGETGENTNDWYVGSFQLLNDYNIGWNLWPWKKMSCENSPYSINKPNGWDRILNAIKGKEDVSKEEAKKIFNELLENIKIENCRFNNMVVNSVLKKAPLRIQGEFYDYKGQGISFGSNGIKKNNIQFREDDNIKISFINESDVITEEYSEIMVHLCETLTEKLQWNKSDLRKRGNRKAFFEMYKRSIESHGLNSSKFAEVRDNFLEELEKKLKSNSVDLRDDFNINKLVADLKKHKLNYWFSGERHRLMVTLGKGEWTEYTINLPEDGEYRVNANISGDDSSVAYINVDNNENELTTFIGDFEEKSILVEENKGVHKIKVGCKNGCVNLDWIEVNN